MGINFWGLSPTPRYHFELHVITRHPLELQLAKRITFCKRSSPELRKCTPLLEACVKVRMARRLLSSKEALKFLGHTGTLQLTATTNCHEIEKYPIPLTIKPIRIDKINLV